jgi:outer membrane protein TolC
MTAAIRLSLAVVCGGLWLQAQTPLTVQRPTLPVPLRSYQAPGIPQARLFNSGRLNRLIRAGKLYLSVQDVLALAIENNLNLEIARYGPLLAQSALERARAGGPIRGVQSASAQVSSVNAGVGVNGSTLSAGLSNSFSNGGNTAGGAASIQQIGQVTPQLDPFVQYTTIFGHLTQPQSNILVSQTPVLLQSVHTYNGVVNQGILTGGSLQLRNYEQYLEESAPTDLINPAVGPHMDLTVNQPLLRGFGLRLNDRFIRIGEVNIGAAGEAFRSQVIDLVTNVLNLYWDLVSASDELKARRQATENAQQFYDDTQKEIAVGAVPRADRLRAEAEVARSRQELTVAENNLGQRQILLKEALSRTEDPALEAAEIIPVDHVEVAENENLPALRELVATALQKRPDVALSKFQEQTARMALPGTENPLLPNLAAYGQTYNRGAAGTPQTVRGFQPNEYFVGGYGSALGQVFRRDFPTTIGGVQISAALHNRQAQGDYGIDQLQFRQSQVSEQRDLNQIVVDVSARVGALRQARARYSTALDTERLQTQLLEADRKKFVSGTATFNDIIIDQRSLVTAQISVVTARSAYAHARVALDQVLGETLEQHNISMDDAVKGQVTQ